MGRMLNGVFGSVSTWMSWLHIAYFMPISIAQLRKWPWFHCGHFQVARSEALAVDAACLTGVEDLLTLGDFNEPVPWQTWLSGSWIAEFRQVWSSCVRLLFVVI